MERYTVDHVPAYGNHWVSKKQFKISLAQLRSTNSPIAQVAVGAKCIDVEKKKMIKVRGVSLFVAAVFACDVIVY